VPRRAPKPEQRVDNLDIQDAISDRIVAVANELAEVYPEADPWDIADGVMSGAVHWWLYANAPCGDPNCENCADVQTAELRMKTLHKLVTDLAESSEYYHSPNDANVARA
jgi:hypothetical protein